MAEILLVDEKYTLQFEKFTKTLSVEEKIDSKVDKIDRNPLSR